MQVFPGDSINVPSTSSAVAGIHYTNKAGAISTRSGVLVSNSSGKNEAMDMDGAKKAEKFAVHVPEQRRVGCVK